MTLKITPLVAPKERRWPGVVRRRPGQVRRSARATSDEATARTLRVANTREDGLTHGFAQHEAPPELRPRPLYTIGHSTRPVAELIEILQASAVTRVGDIRRIPRSRANPQFDIAVLPETLAVAGIEYVHLAALGGLRAKGGGNDEDANAGWVRRPFRNYANYAQTAAFQKGLRDLLEMAARQTCAILCAEAVWWRCHRRIVTDHVLAHGVPVIHLFSTTKHAPASLTPFALVDDRPGVSYPAPPQSRTTGRGTRRSGAAVGDESGTDKQRAPLRVDG